jgi:polyisoprenoid-binding protein YceI
MRAWIATLLLAGVAVGVATARPVAQRVSELESTSRVEFSMRTRWGQILFGRFPDATGDVVQLPDGRRQVRITLKTATVDIVDHPRYTRYARGPNFFDASNYPEVQFHSDPYTTDLLKQGGDLHGRLRMHGIERREKFVLTPAQCARPGRDCPIVVEGTVLRGDYDLDGWRMAMRDEVRFALKVRLRDVESGQTP